MGGTYHDQGELPRLRFGKSLGYLVNGFLIEYRRIEDSRHSEDWPWTGLVLVKKSNNAVEPLIYRNARDAQAAANEARSGDSVDFWQYRVRSGRGNVLVQDGESGDFYLIPILDAKKLR